MKFFIAFYLAAFVAANLIVKHYGAPGLWLSSFLLIPFDFVCRCLFHEKWQKKRLIVRLLALTAAAAAFTVILNWDAKNVAIASVCGFCAAQLFAGLFYQANKQRSWFFKVNISDLLAIIADSIVFQLIAFGELNPLITAGQIVVKFTGGLLWYFIIFKKLKLHEKIISR